MSPIVHFQPISVLKRQISRFPFLLRLAPLITVLLLLLGISPVLAHGYILRAIPDDRAVLDYPPARIQYWFSEPLEKQFSDLTVRDQAGNVIATGGVSDSDNSLIMATLPRGLPDGAYVVDMRLAFASDGHVVAQSVVFFVGKTVAGVSGSAATNQANAFEVIWRLLLLSSTALLFGAFAIYTFILIRAWGNPIYRAGLLPPRVMRRLHVIVIAGLVVAFLSGILSLLQQTMVFFNADIGQVISQSLWQVVRIGTRFGDLWMARMFLLALVAAMVALSLFFREEQPETTRPTWTAGVWGMALVIGTISAGSHASGSLILPWIGIVNDWLHTLAVSLWAGGLAALVLVLPVALEPYQGEARRLALLAALQRFSRMAVFCVALVITTGIYSALTWINQPSDVTNTPFGLALILKLVLVAALLLMGLVHHMALRPERYQKWTDRVNRLTHLHLGKGTGLLGTLRLEIVFVVLVLGSAGLLSASPPPVPAYIKPSVPSPTATQTVGDYSVELTLTPGGPGVNTYNTLITQNGQPVDGLKVQVQWVSPERGLRSDWQDAENAESGLYITSGADIDQAGHWWSLVSITGADGTVSRTAFDWQISDAAAVQTSQPPGVLNILALISVLVVLLWIAYPFARMALKRLDLSPVYVTLAATGVAAMIFIAIFSIATVQNAQAEYVATLNPLPKIINTVLPDSASLQRGQQLYQQFCPAWQGHDLNPFIARLDHARDDELYDSLIEGWQTLPACDSHLEDQQRWDIVNYLRTFQKT